MGATQYATRAMVLTDKAKALFRERRIKNSNTLVSDILWLASAEFGRQRSEGFVMWETYAAGLLGNAPDDDDRVQLWIPQSALKV